MIFAIGDSVVLVEDLSELDGIDFYHPPVNTIGTVTDLASLMPDDVCVSFPGCSAIVQCDPEWLRLAD